jgi:Pvc16 N-terminal domain
MLDAAIGLIAAQLNQALRSAFQLSEDLVMVTNLVDVSGNVPVTATNRLVLFLANIERETVIAGQGMRVAAGGGDRDVVAQTSAAVHLNLMLMFAANFGGNQYTEALKFIAATVGFFQGRALFDHHNSPDLDPRIERLVLEMESLDLAELANLWGILGGKYVPSVLYRMRMISFDSGHITQLAPRVARAVGGVSGGSGT